MHIIKHSGVTKIKSRMYHMFIDRKMGNNNNNINFKEQGIQRPMLPGVLETSPTENWAQAAHSSGIHSGICSAVC